MYGLTTVGQQQFNTAVACAVLSGVAVGIRIFSKIRHKQGMRLDDWWILIALVWYWASVAVVLWGSITGGLGKETEELLVEVKTHPAGLRHMSNYLKSTFLGLIFVTTAIYACKMSVLLFYRHICFVAEGYRRASLAVMGVSTAWYIAAQVSNLLSCHPIDSFWNLSKPGQCLNFNAMFLGTGIADTVIDIFILLLPIRMALKLQLPRKTRVAVAGIFGLGGFVVITNIIRIRYVYQPNQKYVSLAEAERWSHIHMVTAFTCACLPIYKPLWTSISSATSSFISRYANSLRSLISSRDNDSKSDTYLRMDAIENSGSAPMYSHERDIECGAGPSCPRKLITIHVDSRRESDQEPLHVPRGSIGHLRELNDI